MNNQELRKKRMRMILSLIIKDGLVDKEKLLSLISYEWGVARRTGLEYLRTLETAGKIKFNSEGFIIIKTS